MTDYGARYAEYLGVLTGYFDAQMNIDCPETLVSAMRYAFFSGGKRLRPVIMLATADYFGVDKKEILPFCFAIELIHTHSLVHDDLPEMDNDDLRRGKPTCHKVYGEATALIAGDTLLNFAYEKCLKTCDNLQKVKALSYLAERVGSCGMLVGQALDIERYKNGKDIPLHDIYVKKTSALFTASLVVPALIKGLDGEIVTALEGLGESFGELFQLTDDLLDVEKDGSAVKVEVLKSKVEVAEKNALFALEKVGEWEFFKKVITTVAERDK